MDIISKLNEVRSAIPKERKDELEVIDRLFTLATENNNVLPQSFEIKCSMDSISLQDFLDGTLGLNVKDVRLSNMALLIGKIVNVVELSKPPD